MNTRLIVDSSNQLKELSDAEPSQSQVIRILAKIISYIFHPVFVPIYIVLFLLYLHPRIFTGFSEWEKTLVLFQAVVPYFLFPVVTVLLLRGLNFISSVYLLTKKDRIIPFIACNLWYFWIWYVWLNQRGYPIEIVILSLAIFISSSAGILANIYMKISMHSIAMGILVSFMLLLATTYAVSFSVYLAITLLIAGLVCTARLIVSDHTPKEVYAGLLLGFASMVLSNWFN